MPTPHAEHCRKGVQCCLWALYQLSLRKVIAQITSNSLSAMQWSWNDFIHIHVLLKVLVIIACVEWDGAGRKNPYLSISILHNSVSRLSIVSDACWLVWQLKSTPKQNSKLLNLWDGTVQSIFANNPFPPQKIQRTKIPIWDIIKWYYFPRAALMAMNGRLTFIDS